MSCEGCPLSQIKIGGEYRAYSVGFTLWLQRIYRVNCPKCASGSINILGKPTKFDEFANTSNVKVESVLNLLDCDGDVAVDK